MAFDYKPFEYVSPPGLHSAEPRHPVVIVGAGPIGLAAALELANYGVSSIVLDDNNVVSVGSRAICWSKRSLEILDRIELVRPVWPRVSHGKSAARITGRKRFSVSTCCPRRAIKCLPS